MGTHKTQTVVGLRLLTTELWKTKIKTNTHVQHLPISKMLGQIEGRKRRGRQGMRQVDGLTDSMTWVWASSRRWRRTGKPGMLQYMQSQRIRPDWATGQQQWCPYARRAQFQATHVTASYVELGRAMQLAKELAPIHQWMSRSLSRLMPWVAVEICALFIW